MFRTIKHRRNKVWLRQTAYHEVAAAAEKVLNSDVRSTSIHLHRAESQLRYTRYKHICFLSGKARGILAFGLSRHTIKLLGTRGMLLGFRKASW